jgi:hypothetical protein
LFTGIQYGVVLIGDRRFIINNYSRLEFRPPGANDTCSIGNGMQATVKTGKNIYQTGLQVRISIVLQRLETTGKQAVFVAEIHGLPVGNTGQIASNGCNKSASSG